MPTFEDESFSWTSRANVQFELGRFIGDTFSQADFSHLQNNFSQCIKTRVEMLSQQKDFQWVFPCEALSLNHKRTSRIVLYSYVSANKRAAWVFAVNDELLELFLRGRALVMMIWGRKLITKQLSF